MSSIYKASDLKVSLNTVVYNEAHRIAEFLELNAPFVDEIVIVDQGSTDGTFVVAANWADKNNRSLVWKTDRHWGYCESSRKLAWEHSTGDWILVLDADEHLTDEFALQMYNIPEMGYLGAKLKRSFWLAGEHRFTGDHQFRYFNRNHVMFLDEIHTDPQPTCSGDRIISTDFVAIMHEKSWQEQILDELNYEILINNMDTPNKWAKLELNQHLKLLRETGITASEADAMTIEERNSNGIGSS